MTNSFGEPASGEQPASAEGDQLLPGLSEVIQSHDPIREYSVLVTSLEWENLTLAQLYRDRGDVENAFAELKNQRGWGGFTTQDLKRTQITARMTAIVYNWWSLFVRLVDPMTAQEVITSRPLLLTGAARAAKRWAHNIVPQQQPCADAKDQRRTGRSDTVPARASICAAVDIHKALVPHSRSGSREVPPRTQPKATSTLVTRILTNKNWPASNSNRKILVESKGGIK